MSVNEVKWAQRKDTARKKDIITRRLKLGKEPCYLLILSSDWIRNSIVSSGITFTSFFSEFSSCILILDAKKKSINSQSSLDHYDHLRSFFFIPISILLQSTQTILSILFFFFASQTHTHFLLTRKFPRKKTFLSIYYFFLMHKIAQSYTLCNMHRHFGRRRRSFFLLRILNTREKRSEEKK